VGKFVFEFRYSCLQFFVLLMLNKNRLFHLNSLSELLPFLPCVHLTVRVKSLLIGTTPGVSMTYKLTHISVHWRFTKLDVLHRAHWALKRRSSCFNNSWLDWSLHSQDLPTVGGLDLTKVSHRVWPPWGRNWTFLGECVRFLLLLLSKRAIRVFKLIC